MVYFCSTAIAEDHRLGDLSNGNLFSPTSGSYRSKVKVPTGLESSGGLSSWPGGSCSLPDLYMVYFLCTSMSESPQSFWIRDHPYDLSLPYLLL